MESTATGPSLKVVVEGSGFRDIHGAIAAPSLRHRLPLTIPAVTLYTAMRGARLKLLLERFWTKPKFVLSYNVVNGPGLGCNPRHDVFTKILGPASRDTTALVFICLASSLSGAYNPESPGNTDSNTNPG